MLQGMVIGYVKTDINDQLSYVASFIPKIDNWSVCDSFCIGLKFTKEHRGCMGILSYLSSKMNMKFDLA